MNTKHTPGPWQWYWREEDGEANCGVFHEERKGLARSICRAPRYEQRDQWEHNARLIAAVPELLEQCKKAEQVYEYLKMWPLLQEVRAAIAKATGEAS